MAWILTALLFVAIGLVAWWVVPLIVHYTPNAAALVHAPSANQVVTWFAMRAELSGCGLRGSWR